MITGGILPYFLPVILYYNVVVQSTEIRICHQLWGDMQVGQNPT